jgi:chromosome partitioning protein
MAWVITFANTKGGVGKSTLAVELAVYLSDYGKRVGFINVDDQTTSTRRLESLTPQAITLISHQITAANSAKRTTEVKEAITRFSTISDYTIIDTPGSVALETSQAIAKADVVVIPMHPSADDIHELANTLVMVNAAREVRGGEPTALLVLNGTAPNDVQIPAIKVLAKELGVTLCQTTVNRVVPIRDSSGSNTVSTRYSASRSRKSGERMRALCEEILSHLLYPQKEVAND